MRRYIFVSFCMSVLAFALTFDLITNQEDGPYFVNTVQIMPTYSPMQMLNRQMSDQEAVFNKNLSIYEDSISKILGLLETRNDSLESLLQLLNMEMNVFQHKTIDSISNSSKVQLNFISAQFNDDISLFCKKTGTEVLFDANNNTIVFGTKMKSDKTQEMIDFLKGK